MSPKEFQPNTPGELNRDPLLHVSQRAAWNEWIELVVDGIAEQARDAILRANRLFEMQRNYRERMQQVSPSSAVLRLVDQLFAAPFVTIPGVAKLLELTHRAATQSVESWWLRISFKKRTLEKRLAACISPRRSWR